MAITATKLESDKVMLQLISQAKRGKELDTEYCIKEFRENGKLESPHCLFELRNGVFVGTGDYILKEDNQLYFCSANGSRKEVDAEFIYEFCRGCANTQSVYIRPINE